MGILANQIFYVSVVGSLKGGHVACRTIRVPLQTLSVVMHGLHHQGMRVADVTDMIPARADVGATPQLTSAKQSFRQCAPLTLIGRNLISPKRPSASASALPSQPPGPNGAKAVTLLWHVEHFKDAIGWTASFQLFPLNTLQKSNWIRSFNDVDPPGADTEW